MIVSIFSWIWSQKRWLLDLTAVCVLAGWLAGNWLDADNRADNYSFRYASERNKSARTETELANTKAELARAKAYQSESEKQGEHWRLRLIAEQAKGDELRSKLTASEAELNAHVRPVPKADPPR